MARVSKCKHMQRDYAYVTREGTKLSFYSFHSFPLICQVVHHFRPHSLYTSLSHTYYQLPTRRALLSHLRPPMKYKHGYGILDTIGCSDILISKKLGYEYV